jgi:hypothetical protein
MPRKKATPAKGPKTRGKPKRTATAKPTPVFNARPIYSERELRVLSLGQEQARGNALQALSLMRSQGYSLTRAAREVEMTREAVRAWTGRSITKKGRRFVARGADKLVREMQVLTERGPQTVPMFDSRAASQLGAYHAAVKEALRGRPEALKAFRRKTLRTGGKRALPFITDLRVLKRLAQAGALPEYQIYGLRAA